MTITLCFQLCSALYTALQMKNSTRSVPAINPVVTENMVISIIANTATGKLHHTIKLTPCVVSDNNCNTNEDKSKSIMCVLYVLWLVKIKAHVRTKLCRTVKKSSL